MDATTISMAIAIGSLVAQLLGMILAGVWVVAKISTTTALLKQAIDALKDSINHLRDWLECVDERTDGHTERIARIEEKLKGHPSS